MPRRLTNEEFIQKAKEVYPEYDYSLTNYVNAQTPVKIICPNCGVKEIKATYILSGRGCSCEKHKYVSKKIIKALDKKLLEEKFPTFEFDYSTFKGNFSGIKIKCKMCNNFFERNVSNLKTKKQGCPWCSGRNKTTSIIVDQLEKKYGKKTFDFSKVKYTGNSRDPQIIICKNCSKEFTANTHDMLTYYGKKCPYCSKSKWKGEERIKNWFEENSYLINEDFFKEFSFEDLVGKNKKLLRYDFYLPKKNLLIEYNGEQHYEPRKVFGGEEAFTKRKEYDKLKENYAKLNGFELLVIPYWKFGNIEEMLDENIGKKC